MHFIVSFLLCIAASQNQIVKVSYNDQTYSFYSSELTINKIKSVFNISDVKYLENLSGVRFYPFFDGAFPSTISSEVFVRQQLPKQIPVAIYATDSRYIFSNGAFVPGKYSTVTLGYKVIEKNYRVVYNHFKDLSIINLKKKISKVYLRMVGTYSESVLPTQVFVHRCDIDWKDITIWNQQPLYNPEPYSSVIIKNPVEVSFFWDVTNIVVDWVTGVFPNYGILLKTNDSWDVPTCKDFYSADAFKRPCLLVYYNE